MALDLNVTPFQYPVLACKTSNSAGSLLLIQNTVDCSATPVQYRIDSVGGNIVAGATTATLTLSSATLDGEAVPVPASITLRANSRLYLTTAANPLYTTYLSFPQEVVITNSTIAPTGTIVTVDPVAVTIPSANFALTYAMLLVEKATDLPINVEAETSNTRVLADGLQITQNVTGLNLNAPVTFFSSPEDTSQFEVLQRAALNTANIYVLITKTSGNLAFGSAKVLGISYTGDFSDEVATSTLNFQSWAVAHATSDTRVNSTLQLNAINRIYALAGLPTVA